MGLKRGVGILMGTGYITYVEDWGNGEFAVHGIAVSKDKGYQYKKMDLLDGEPEDYSMAFREDFLADDLVFEGKNLNVTVHKYENSKSSFDIVYDEALRDTCVGKVSKVLEDEVNKSYVVRLVVKLFGKEEPKEVNIKVISVGGFTNSTPKLRVTEVKKLIEDISQDVIEELEGLRYIIEDINSRSGYQLNENYLTEKTITRNNQR